MITPRIPETSAPRVLRGPSLSLLTAFAIAVPTLLFVVNGAIPQLEMALFAGNIPVSVGLTNYLLYAAIAFASLTTKQFNSTRRLFQGALFLACYLLIDAIHLNLNEGLSSAEIYRTYLGYFSILLLALICVSLSLKVNEQIFLSLILLMFAINIVIAILQFATDSPILPTESIDRGFIVHVSTFIGGQQRAFGLFSTSGLFGIFCSLIGSLGVGIARKRKHFLFGMLLISLAGFGCFATLTRAPMVIFICSIVSVYIIASRRWRAVVSWLPLAWGAVAGILMLYSFRASPSSTSLASTDSMYTRFGAWASSFNSFASGTFMEKLFGIGIVPSSENIGASGRTALLSPSKISPFPIDNVAIILLLYVGLAGVVIVALLLTGAWRFVLRKAIDNGTPLQLALAAIYSTFFLASVFDFTLSVYSAVFLIAVLNYSPQHAQATSIPIMRVSEALARW